jgi:hypothetical protein
MVPNVPLGAKFDEGILAIYNGAHFLATAARKNADSGHSRPGKHQLHLRQVKRGGPHP